MPAACGGRSLGCAACLPGAKTGGAGARCIGFAPWKALEGRYTGGAAIALRCTGPLDPRPGAGGPCGMELAAPKGAYTGGAAILTAAGFDCSVFPASGRYGSGARGARPATPAARAAVGTRRVDCPPFGPDCEGRAGMIVERGWFCIRDLSVSRLGTRSEE